MVLSGLCVMLAWADLPGVAEAACAAGALSAHIPGQGQGELPEAAEDVCTEPSPPQTAQEPAAQEPLPGAQGHKVLPDHHSGLGGGWLAGNVIINNY